MKTLGEDLKRAVIDCDEEEAKRIAREIVKVTNLDTIEVIEKFLSPAMETVGKKFETGEYFLAHLMLAGETMNSVMDILLKNISEETRAKLSQRKGAKIVIGTVKGDIHDIGKNVVVSLLKAAGFEVFDLGKDVAPMEFVNTARKTKADVIALSALMTTTMPYQAEVIKLLDETGQRKDYKVIIGGGPTSQEWAKKIGADGWASTASQAAGLVREVMKS